MSKKILSIVLIVVILFLVAVMVWAMVPAANTTFPFSVSCMGMRFNPNFSSVFGNLPEDAARGLTYEVAADSITGVDLDFLHENIEVVLWEGNTVKLEQTSSQALAEDDYMRYGVMGGKLVAESPHLGRLSVGVQPGSRITVSIPASLALDGSYSTASGWVSVGGGNYGRLSIDTSSGNVQAFNATAHDVDIDTASGEVELQTLQSEMCDVDTASGNITAGGVYRSEFRAITVSGSINFTGESASVRVDTTSGGIQVEVAGLRQFDADAVSGEVSLTCLDADALQEINIDTISGGVTLKLPENNGFDLDYDSISGALRNTGFEMMGDRHKNGGAEINVDSTSGSLTIEKI